MTETSKEDVSDETVATSTGLEPATPSVTG